MISTLTGQHLGREMKEQLTEVLLCSFGQLGGLLYLLWDSHKLGLYNQYPDLVERSHFSLL